MNRGPGGCISPAAPKNSCPPAICSAQGSCHPKPAAGDVSIYLT
ncbi:hypothetical protein C4J97_5338 [Pseudomonas orientalis]|nr:hypothetical protein C4J97_5338 [Pseudomonas orientalis]